MTRIQALRHPCLLLCPLAGPLPAQEVQVDLTGSILTTTGTPLPSAGLEVRHLATGYRRQVRTDPEGRFIVACLPLGAYEVTASCPRFIRVKVRQDLVMNAAPRMTFHLPEAACAEVVVKGTSSTLGTLDVGRASATTVVSPEALQSLPLKGRGFMAFAALTPGVSRAQYGNLSIAGQRAHATGFLIDGMPITQPFFGGATGSVENKAPYTFSLESIEAFEIVAAGAPAQFGQMAGGYLNAVTKSGANQPHGSAFYSTRPSGLTARDPVSGEPLHGFQHAQFGGSLGGPILKDKLFYFFSLDAQRESSRIPFRWGGSGPPVLLDPRLPSHAALLSRQSAYATQADTEVLFGRLDGMPSPGHSLTLRVNATRFRGDTGPGANNQNYAYEGTASSQASTLAASVHWNWIVGPDWIQEARLGWVQDDLPVASRGGLPVVHTPNLGIYGGFANPRESKSRRMAFFQALTFARPAFQAKAGLDLNLFRLQQTLAPYPNGAYTFAGLRRFEAGKWSHFGQTQGLGASAAQAGRMTARSRDLAFFLQTETALTSTLRLGAGVRWDEQRHSDFPIADVSRGPLGYPAPGRNPVEAHIPTDRALSLRTSFTFTPGTRTVIRASWGQYVSRTPLLFDYGSYQGNGHRLALAVLPGGPDGPLPWGENFPWDAPPSLSGEPAPTRPPALFTYSARFRNPRTQVASLGITRALGPWTLGLTGITSKTFNLQRIQDQNLGTPSPNPQGRLVFPKARPNPLWGPWFVYVSDASSRYQALTFSAAFQPDGGPWDARFHYTWAKDQDNDSNERIHAGYQTQNTQRLEDEWGPSNRDIRHTFIGQATFQDRHWTGIKAGLVVSLQSGTPYSVVKTRDMSNDANAFNDRVLGTARNGFRTCSRTQVDLRLARDFPCVRAARGTISLELFNLFNHQDTYQRLRAISDLSDAATVQMETVPTPLSSQRSAQLGLRIYF